MSLNSTPSSDRVHIGIFGRRNAGKSSVINALTGQDFAIVSDVKGTTTDPVYKTMELLPLGPVMIIDTPGIDDRGELGKLRVNRSYQVLNKTDIAVVVINSAQGKTFDDEKLIDKIKDKNIPFVVVYNKSDCKKIGVTQNNEISVSAKTNENINELKELIAAQLKTETVTKKLVGDLLKPNDFVVLVIPIDSSAPKGRLILPQQQTIRDILESGAAAIACRDTELTQTLKNLGKPPALVITDSQAFGKVSKAIPKNIPLTSFSILFSRMKGNLTSQVNGAKSIDKLNDNDIVLISEGCTHHRQCEDIGTVKIPKWLGEYTGKSLNFEFTSGCEFPDDLSKYKLIIHCGGCMLNEREMQYRLKCADDQNVLMTNYGTAIAYIHGILERSLEPFNI